MRRQARPSTARPDASVQDQRPPDPPDQVDRYDPSEPISIFNHPPLASMSMRELRELEDSWP